MVDANIAIGVKPSVDGPAKIFLEVIWIEIEPIPKLNPVIILATGTKI